MTGKEFEYRLNGLGKASLEKFVSTIGSKSDLYDGTDCFYKGMPVDWCLGTRYKDFCTDLGTCGVVVNWKDCGKIVYRIHFEVKTANNYRGYSNFDIPVLVVRFTQPDRNEESVVMRKYFKNLGKILDSGKALYDNWIKENRPDLAVA